MKVKRVAIIALFSLLALIVALPILLFLALIGDSIYESYIIEYHDDDSRYSSIRQSFRKRLTDSLDGKDLDHFSIDLTAINHGDWEKFCIIGGYQDASKTAVQIGGKFNSADRKRIEFLSRRMWEIEEFETALIFTDSRSQAHFVHFRGSFGPGSQHFEKCISKPETVMQLW